VPSRSKHNARCFEHYATHTKRASNAKQSKSQSRYQGNRTLLCLCYWNGCHQWTLDVKENFGCIILPRIRVHTLTSWHSYRRFGNMKKKEYLCIWLSATLINQWDQYRYALTVKSLEIRFCKRLCLLFITQRYTALSTVSINRL